ncbi:MAG: type II toxin-antitoxin system HicB family antitoxin [Planctomycetota bacterium]
MLKHRGYVGHADLDVDAGVLHGEILGIRDVVTFEGTSVDELQKAFEDSVDDYLEMCEERGEEPNKPCSGKILLRTSPEHHLQLLLDAKRNGVSLNSWVVDKLEPAAN